MFSFHVVKNVYVPRKNNFGENSYEREILFEKLLWDVAQKWVYKTDGNRKSGQYKNKDFFPDSACMLSLKHNGITVLIYAYFLSLLTAYTWITKCTMTKHLLVVRLFFVGMIIKIISKLAVNIIFTFEKKSSDKLGANFDSCKAYTQVCDLKLFVPGDKFCDRRLKLQTRQIFA
jgi:hypothetical protein